MSTQQKPNLSVFNPSLTLPSLDYDQVWTYASRVAFVLSVTAKGQPIHEDIRLQRLQQLLLLRMSPDGHATVNTHKVALSPHLILFYSSSFPLLLVPTFLVYKEKSLCSVHILSCINATAWDCSLVSATGHQSGTSVDASAQTHLQVRGEVHHDRRLHQLMLSEAESHYDLSAGKGVFSSSPPLSTGAQCSDSAGSVHSDLAAAAMLANSPAAGPDDLFRCLLDVSAASQMN